MPEDRDGSPGMVDFPARHGHYQGIGMDRQVWSTIPLDMDDTNDRDEPPGVVDYPARHG